MVPNKISIACLLNPDETKAKTSVSPPVETAPAVNTSTKDGSAIPVKLETHMLEKDGLQQNSFEKPAAKVEKPKRGTSVNKPPAGASRRSRKRMAAELSAEADDHVFYKDAGAMPGGDPSSPPENHVLVSLGNGHAVPNPVHVMTSAQRAYPPGYMSPEMQMQMQMQRYLQMQQQQQLQLQHQHLQLRLMAEATHYPAMVHPQHTFSAHDPSSHSSHMNAGAHHLPNPLHAAASGGTVGSVYTNGPVHGIPVQSTVIRPMATVASAPAVSAPTVTNPELSHMVREIAIDPKVMRCLRGVIAKSPTVLREASVTSAAWLHYHPRK